jgi:DNA-binding IclR family transcriptional regulator
MSENGAQSLGKPSGRVKRTAAEAAGSQSLGRAIGLLRVICQNWQSGLRLADLSAATGLHRATTHRLLVALIREGLIEQDGSHCYHPGVELWLMGMDAGRRFDLVDLARPALDRIAAETQDTVFLSVRSKDEAVCIDLREGSFPIRTLTLSVGDRRPLGIGAGSLALLAFAPEEIRDDLLDSACMRLDTYAAFSRDTIRNLVRQTQDQGYAYNPGMIVPGMNAVAVPVLDRAGMAMAAFSVATIEARMTEPRRGQIVDLLRGEASALSQRLGGGARPAGREGGSPRRRATGGRPPSGA